MDSLVICDAPGDDHVVATVAGLPVITRIVMTLLRAGASRVQVAAGAHAAAVEAALAGHRGVAAAGERVSVTVAAPAPAAAGPVLVWPADRLFDVPTVKQAMSAAGGASVDLSTRPGLPVRTPDERRAAQKSLLAALRKAVDGPVSVYLNRPMSLAVTRMILDTKITPNQMTVVANVIGAIGVWFVFQCTWTSLAIGGLLVHLQSVLDGCDGELARLKFQSSRFGEWFDNVTDNTVNAAYGMGLGWATAELMGWPVFRWIGVGSALGFLLYDLVVYWQLAFVHRTGSPWAFRWWFQTKDADLSETFAGGGTGARIAGFFRALGRRDVFLFCFMLLCFARLPYVASVWYALLAAGHLVMTLLHLANGGMPRALVPPRP